MSYELEVIDFKDDDVILRNKNNKLIYWPKSDLPQIPTIGQIISFSIGSTDKAELLNELLRTEN